MLRTPKRSSMAFLRLRALGRLRAPALPGPVPQAAASLLGLAPSPSDKETAKATAQALLARLDAGALPPLVRLRAATSLFLLGGGSERARGKSELRSFLRSEDEN